jgi:O-antigen/teichoic acid export membrane protein
MAIKNTIYKIYDKFGIKSDRTKNITKHVLLSFLYKGGSIIASFLLVPLTIDYLDTENYGIWLTLSSFISWFSFFDIGLGNGLRNKFAEAKAKGDMATARGYVSSAYFTIGAFSLGLIVLFTGLNFFIDWTKIFNASPNLGKDLSVLMPIVFGFFCLQLVVKLITTIYTADQNHSMQGKINFYTQAGSVLIIWIMTKASESSLLIFGAIFSSLPVFLLLWFNLFAFNKRYFDFKPSIKYWKKAYLRDIFGLGLNFFIIQISGIVLYSTDNFIISKLFSPAEVVPYNIAYKYIGMASMLFSIIAAPYWSSITEAYSRLDFEWIKLAMKNFQRISLLFVVLIFCMTVISSLMYQVWIGNKVFISFNLTLLMGIFFSFSIIVTPFTIFFNGTGKIWLQAVQSVFSAILNIPLSIYLASNVKLGIEGVILSTILCFIPSIVLSRIQYKKLINNKATGVWNR